MSISLYIYTVLTNLTTEMTAPAPVSLGDPVTLSWNIIKGDTDFSISWIVDGDEYFCDRSNLPISANIHCFINDTVTLLQISYTTFLGANNVPVECNLRNIFHSNYTSDPSFIPDFHAHIKRETNLVIQEKSFVTSKSYCVLYNNTS